MYKKTKHKRRIIRIRECFETHILPYILTGFILFICFIVAIALGVEFNSPGNMIIWVFGIGFVVGNILVEYLKTNIKSIIKWACTILEKLFK